MWAAAARREEEKGIHTDKQAKFGAVPHSLRCMLSKKFAPRCSHRERRTELLAVRERGKEGRTTEE